MALLSKRQTFALPSCTPADTGYPNIPPEARKFGTNRPFKRVNSAEENDSSLLWNLKKYWGYSAFRGPQLDICRSVIRDRDVLVVAPTGLGKSLCFQVPAMTLEYGITLVVSPLKALMHDQVNTLVNKGVPAMMACQETPAVSQKEIIRQLRLAHPNIRLLYITPESLFTGQRYKDAIRACFDNRQMRRLVIDEAHCIDGWGRSFRPSYRLLGDFRRLFPGIPITALTASATAESRQDILESLGIPKDNLDVWVEPCNRKNLFYEVLYRGPECEENVSVEDQIVMWLKKHRPSFQERNKKHGISPDCVTGLVYCRKRATCEALAARLQKAGMRARAFHAEMPQAVKEAVQADWLAGRIEVVCATIAFGMGIDQSHVRYVVHYDMPSSVENYYQETGRAGRDGHMSRCALIYSREDANDNRQKLAQPIAPPKGDASFDQEKADKDADINRGRQRIANSFAWLQANYIENVSVCRHIALCRYFGEVINEEDLAMRRSYCDGMCDVCTEPAQVARRAAMLNDDIGIASQVVLPEIVPITAPPSAHPSSDNARPVGTMAMLFASGRSSSSGLGPSSDNNEDDPLTPFFHAAPAPLRAVAPISDKPFKPPSSATRSSLPTPTTSSGGAMSAPALVPPSLTSQGKRRFGLVDYSSTVPSAESSSAEKRTPLSDLNSSGRVNEGKKRRTLAEQSEGSKKRKAALAEAQKEANHRSSGGPAPASAPKTKAAGKRKQPPADSPYSSTPAHRPYQPGRPRRSSTFTIDSLVEGPGEGSYALAAPPPEDANKRKKQRKDFEDVEAVDGDGPFAYYNSPGVGVAGPSRAVSRVQAGFRTPFRSPIVQAPVKSRVGPILAETRKEALQTLQSSFLANFAHDGPGRRVWAYWDCPTGEKRVQTIKRVARDVEAEIVKECHTAADFRQDVASLVKAMKLLQIPHVIDSIVGGELAGEFGDGPSGGWMRLVERCARTRADKSRRDD